MITCLLFIFFISYYRITLFKAIKYIELRVYIMEVF